MAEAGIELFIPAIHCNGCLQTVARIAEAQGAAFVSGDARTKLVRLRFEPSTTTQETLTDALTEVGFPPEERR